MLNSLRTRSTGAIFFFLAAVTITASADDDLAKQLRELESRVLSNEEATQAVADFQEQLRGRIREANQRSTDEWRTIKTREDWLTFRRDKLALLRQSLGNASPPDRPLGEHIVGTIPGDGFVIEKLLIENNLGLWITANLYKPTKPAEAMPGILICHCHHAPKTQVELQDMGMMWARAGCVVLVPDQLGHGERRQHPFATEKDFPKEFRATRQDYYFRYDNAVQLHLAGQSLIGQMVGDLIRGVDLLTAQPGVDDEKIILLGSVAGGGDPAAIAAALDERIAAAVPFNFGGPQPETRFPLPDDADAAFNFAGSGGWESTRNLRRSAADGFLPWVIVGGIAPRRLIYAHEFAWDRERDPVWKRLQSIYSLFDAADEIAFTHGRGSVKGQAPESTHCNNIGPVHRQMIHPAFHRWFGIPDLTNKEYSQRIAPDQLLCWTPELKERLVPKTLRSALGVQAQSLTKDVNAAQENRSAADRRTYLRDAWTKVLGSVKPQQPLTVKKEKEDQLGTIRVHRLALETEPQIIVSTILLVPETKDKSKKPPVVLTLAQSGKRSFLQERANDIEALLKGGVAVCLCNPRGTGETSPSSGRDRTSGATSLSSTELMLGGTFVGARLRDVRSLLAYLRTRSDLDANKIGLWGDSFTPANPADVNPRVPHGIDGRPKESEPLGQLLALLGGLYEDNVTAIYTRGGLTSFASVLASPAIYIPHDVVIPGVLTTGDLPQLAATLAPTPLRCESFVDGINRSVSTTRLNTDWQVAIRAHQGTKSLTLDEKETSIGNWFVKLLR